MPWLKWSPLQSRAEPNDRTVWHRWLATHGQYDLKHRWSGMTNKNKKLATTSNTDGRALQNTREALATTSD